MNFYKGRIQVSENGKYLSKKGSSVHLETNIHDASIWYIHNITKGIVRVSIKNESGDNRSLD